MKDYKKICTGNVKRGGGVIISMETSGDFWEKVALN